MLRWLVCACIAVGCAPSRVAGVECGSDADCKLGGVAGKCEPTKFCSYPDPTCMGGRYSPGAGSGLGNTCVGGPAACGDKDQPCCAGMLCGTDLACSSAMTCSCGNTGEPCCGGTTCSANLACTSDGACACGAIGEPCCDGTTCSNGLTCSGGTCSGGVLEVAVGENDTCALRSDHTVTCWGYDNKPYSADTPGMSVPTIASGTPVTIAGATDIVHVRAGAKHTCGTKSDGTMWCWGHNESGELGDGTQTSHAAAVQVAGLTGVTLFDLGKFHTCAVGSYLGTAGTWCWGHGSRGTHATRSGHQLPTYARLGNHDVADQLVPSRVDLSAATSGGQTVRALSAGAHHSCVAMSDNTVWCWGSNNTGQLGTGNTTDSMAPVIASLGGISIPAGNAIEEVVASHGNVAGGSCLRLTNGTTYCWGNGAQGEFGDSTPLSPAPAARNAPTASVTTSALGGAHFVQMSSGAGVVCALDSSGRGWCWGIGYMGALGNNDPMQANQPAPVPVQGLTNATQISVGHRAACAVDSAQQLFCWGNNRRDQLTSATPQGAVLLATKVAP